MSKDAKFQNVKLERAGIMEITKSAAMDALIDGVLVDMLDAATFCFRMNHDITGADLSRDPYVAERKKLNYTSVGVVRENSKRGMYDQNQYHTLDRIARGL